MKNTFNTNEIAIINECLQIHRNDDTITFTNATNEDIVECIDDEFTNDQYHNDMITCDLNDDDDQLIAYVQFMIDVARLHMKIQMINN